MANKHTETPDFSFKSKKKLFQRDVEDSPMFLKFNTNSRCLSFDDDSDVDLSLSLTPVSKKIEIPEEETSRDSGIDLSESRDSSSSEKNELHRKENNFRICRPSRKTFHKRKTFDVRRATKRSASPSDDTIESCSKRLNLDAAQVLGTDLSNINSGKQRIMEALNDMTNDDSLIGDGSVKHTLPTTCGKHKDLKSVTTETVHDLINGLYDDVIDKYFIVDCRYPYEYEGGHIKGAVNLHTRNMVENYFLQNFISSEQRTVLVFHCEFSSERGPKLLRHLRSSDREMNAENYPNLFYPEVYLLDGGYKEFYTKQGEACMPQSYKPMLHQEHTQDLRHFRSKTKSMSVLEKRCLRF